MEDKSIKSLAHTLRMEESVTEAALQCRLGVLLFQDPSVPNLPHGVQSTAHDGAGLPDGFVQLLPLGLCDATAPAAQTVEDG